MKKSLAIHSLVLVGLILPAVALAQTATSTAAGNYTFVPLTNLPGLPTVANSSSLPGFLNSLYKICIGLAAVLAVIQIMRAGFLFMTNKGSVSSNEQAKSLISQSILGLVLVLSPVIVFGIIDPSILNLNLDTSSLQTSTSTFFGGTSSSSIASPNTLSAACSAQYSATYIVPNQNNTNAAQACTTAYPGTQDAGTSCCAGMSTGYVCCGTPKTIDINLKNISNTLNPTSTTP